MASVTKILTQLQRKIGQRDDYWNRDDPQRLTFSEHGGLFWLDYYGLTCGPLNEDTDEAEVLPLFETLAIPEVADKITSLTFRGPDEGYNGIRPWDFSPLLRHDVTFPNLMSLVIEPSALGAHNHTIVDDGTGYYREGGQLAQWLAKAPQLDRLTTPSAPDAQFFQVGPRPMETLQVATGYEHRDFILHLSQANRDSSLQYFRHFDFAEPFGDEPSTPFEHYVALFRSEMCTHTVTLRYPALTEEQLAELKALQELRYPSGGTLMIIRTSYGYFP